MGVRRKKGEGESDVWQVMEGKGSITPAPVSK